MSEIRADKLHNASGDNDSGIDLSTNDQVVIKTADTTAVTVDSSQRVNIGTGTPPTADSVLTVQKSSAANELNIISSPSHASVINLGDTDDYNIARIKADNSDNTLRFQVNNSEAMRIENDGQLSIGGTGSGTATLYVLSSNNDSVSFFQSSSNSSTGIRALHTSLNQNASNTDCQHLRATTQNVGTFRLDGNGASTFTSDERLKKNIETTRDGYLEDLAKLRVVKYNWHCHDEEDKKELGLIAQEVQKVFPKLVVEDDEELNGVEKPLAIKLSVLPMMLLKALQEANTKITALEARITALESE